MLGSGNKRVTDRLMVASAALIILILMAYLALTMAQKGVWFDDQWSKWMSSRELDLAEAATQRWFQDVHPPLFYFVSWSASALVGPDVVTHRWLNLLWVAAMGGVGAYIATVRPAMRPSLVVAALLMISNRDVLLFVEYRSYALIFCATAVLLLLLSEVVNRGRDLVWPDDGLLAILFAAAILLALNLHYVTSLVVGITLFVFAVDQLRLRHWRWLALMTAVGSVGLGFLLAALLAERDYIALTATNFWLFTPFRYAVQTVILKFVSATGLNLVVIICLARTLGARFGQFETPDGGGVPAPAWRFAMLCAISLLSSAVALIGINHFKSVIHARYLVSFGPMTIAILAVLVSGQIMSRRWIFALFAVNAALVAAWTIASIPKKPAWDDGARIVAAQIKACPATIVYSMWAGEFVIDRYPALPNEPPFIEWAMADIAERYRLPVRFIRLDSPGAARPRASGDCPTLVWVENVYFRKPGSAARAVERAGLLAAGEHDVPVSIAWTRTGAVLSIPPPSSPVDRLGASR